ncbi:MAG: ABC transporter ATP-binding protein [candidate division Zixibacteria bacterium]|nr:ABC transporter ATP-binding protein [candidate division Zixibacteria bacterium]
MPSLDYSVEVKNLSMKFGDFTAVDDISFEVRRGEVFGFLGPNGAGKSTTIRMLCGILTPTGGSGSVCGFKLGDDNARIKTVIGYMSQKFSLYEDLTAYENLDFYSGVYPINRNQRRDRIEEALDISRLQPRRHDITGTLPVGLKQRLALVCSLMHKPQVLFLDEPTAGVDPLTRREFWELIYRLSESGVTVFVTTHYMDEVEHCDRIALINAGKLIKVDSPERLKLSGRKILEIECANWQKAFEVLRRHEAQIGESALFGTRIHIAPKTDDVVKIEGILDSSDCKLLSKREIMPSLEDVFVSLLSPEQL